MTTQDLPAYAVKAFVSMQRALVAERILPHLFRRFVTPGTGEINWPLIRLNAAGAPADDRARIALVAHLLDEEDALVPPFYPPRPTFFGLLEYVDRETRCEVLGCLTLLHATIDL